LIPPTTATQARNAFTTQAKHLPRLGAGRYFHLDLAFESGNLDLGAQRRLGKANGNFTDHVSPLPGEQRMITDLNEQE
jgi:hypothetical protein